MPKEIELVKTHTTAMISKTDAGKWIPITIQTNRFQCSLNLYFLLWIIYYCHNIELIIKIQSFFNQDEAIIPHKKQSSMVAHTAFHFSSRSVIKQMYDSVWCRLILLYEWSNRMSYLTCYTDTDEIPGFFFTSSSHAVKILFLSFTCENKGVDVVTNMISQ